MPVDTKQDSDEAVAARVQSGDIEAFGVLVDRYEAKLKRYGTKFLSRTEDIEDIVQDVFVSAYKNIQEFRTAQRFSPWVYRIAHNAFVNALRKSKRGEVFTDLDTLISHQVVDESRETEREQQEMRKFMERGLINLDEKYREVLILHYFEDMPYKEIAEVLEIPVGTVSIRIKRAKEALKKELAHTI